MRNKSSFSKLKILSILSLIIYFFLIVSNFFNGMGDFMIGYSEGSHNARIDPSKTTYYISIEPKSSIINYSDSVVNLKTNQSALIKYHHTALIKVKNNPELDKKISKYKTLSVIMMFLILAPVVLLPIYFMKIMLSMKNEIVFVKQNIRWLRRIGQLLIAYYFFYFIFDWAQYKINSTLFEFKEIAVVKESTNLIWLLLGFVFLLTAEVLSKGSILKEEQDLTI